MSQGKDEVETREVGLLIGTEMLTWHFDEVDRLHVKKNKIVGINYLGIIDIIDHRYPSSHDELVRSAAF